MAGTGPERMRGTDGPQADVTPTSSEASPDRVIGMGAPFFFEPEMFSGVAQDLRERFLAGEPFSHVVIDGLLPDDVLDEVVEESPGPNERNDWLHADRPDTIKWSIPNDWALGPTTRQLLNQFNGATFINFLEELTGISGLIPDPHYFGGGLHQHERDGFLKIHADFNWHQRLHLDRRLNVLLYLNRDWQEDWGGSLELWNAEMTHRVESIAPLFNRMVIFATTDTSYHGHPEPMTCPAGTRRRSLALYYYTNGRPEEEKSPSHSTVYKVRPGEKKYPMPSPPKQRITWRDFSPPIALKCARQVRAALRR